MSFHREEGVKLTQAQQQYLLPHFLMLVVGKPGSGKSYAVQQLINSKQFYGDKYDQVLVISPSAQKLGINARKEDTATVYQLEWIFQQIVKVNQKQIMRFQAELRSRDPKGILKHLPQEVVAASLSKDMSTKSNNRLPPEYVQFNRNQRFFTIETLALLKQGYTALSRLQSQAQQQSPFQAQQQAQSDSMVKGARRKTKAASKTAAGLPATGNSNVITAQYGQYRDVDEIERELVSKLTEAQQKQTAYNMVIVLDDVIGDIKSLENNPQQQQLFFNRRHLIANGTISIIVVSQKYTMCPARIRSNCSWLLLFRLNPVDFDNVYKDVIMLSNDKWDNLLKKIYGTDEDGAIVDKKQKKYDNLGIWVEYDMFFNNFKKLDINKLT